MKNIFKNNEVKSEDTNASTGLLEVCIDQDHITITVDRFAELIKKEALLDITKDICINVPSYDIKEYTKFLFGVAPKEAKEDA